MKEIVLQRKTCLCFKRNIVLVSVLKLKYYIAYSVHNSETIPSPVIQCTGPHARTFSYSYVKSTKTKKFQVGFNKVVLKHSFQSDERQLFMRR